MSVAAANAGVDRPVLKYFGAKWRLASRIIELLGPHDSYVEPFGGSGAVLLRKQESPIEVFNDLNHDVVNFFRVMRDQPELLLEKLELTPFARVEYEESTAPAPDIDDVEKARRFMVRCWQGFSGSGTQKRNGWRFQQRIYDRRQVKNKGDWGDFDRIEQAAVRIRRVQIEHDDALAVMQRFDSKKTVHYVDPPYPSSSRSKSWGKDAYSNFELGIDDHVHLLNMLPRLNGRVILSCYECPLYDDMLKGWEKIEIPMLNQRATPTVEILWIKPAK